MYAIIETGGKQYSVKKGDVLCIEKIDAAEGSVVVIDKVLLVGNDDNTVVVGKPYVEGMGVSAKVVEHGKGDKVLVFKYKPKKKFRKLRGHRQPYTKIEIEAIGADLKAEAPKKAAAPKKEAAPKAEEKPATEKKPAAKKTATKAAAEKPATEKKAPAKKAAAPKAAKPAAEKKPAAKKTATKKVTE